MRYWYLWLLTPFVLIASEFKKFCKLLNYGRLDIDDAYTLGFKEGTERAKDEFKYMLDTASKRMKEASNKLVEDYLGSMQVIEEKPMARDFETGAFVGWAKVVEMKDVHIRMVIHPRQRMFIMPSRYEIHAAIRRAKD